MKEYVVTFQYVSDTDVIVEADNEEDARLLAFQEFRRKHPANDITEEMIREV